MKKLTRLLSNITLKRALFGVGLPLSLAIVAALMIAIPLRPTGLVWLASAVAVVWLTQFIGLAVAWISDNFRAEEDMSGLRYLSDKQYAHHNEAR